MRVGGVILCGGKSTRMGSSKAMLPFGSETMLERIHKIISSVVEPVVVSAARDQELPLLPDEVIVVRDAQPDSGPLQGIADGLCAIADVADAAYVTSCDVPLLSAEFVLHMINALGDHQIVVPREEKFFHPLAAVYRTDVATVAQKLLSEDRRRPIFLFEQCDTREVPIDELRTVDPELHSLMNLNNPDDYEHALRLARIER